ncbi:MAG: xanthine dehydrogenase family protein molybdopterin-binding subunit, partial [Alphaproteobacteria bacterium]|nr:xanthine dehydrogenase family protein molybdopterin-binding subunit [Alphaproteobacteria bacterium]
GAIARHDRAADRVTLTTPSQGAHLLRRWIGEQVLSWPAGRLRVVTPDVGGGFGVRFAAYPEQALLAWAARHLARDLRWSGERSEAFVSDTQSRDQIMQGALALDEAGRFLALEVEIDANLGAAAAGFAAGCVTDSAAKVISGLYRIPAIHMRSTGRFTNTVPVDAYRGAGKPEALFLLERLVDLAAEAAGLDPIEIRRRNLVPSAAMPYRTALGKTYDGGDFAATLDRLVAGADLAGFARRREDSGTAGRLRGLGISCFLHGVGGVADETARVEVLPEGKVIAETGTQSTGQGHETAFARVVADALGVPRDSVALRQGDSDRLPRGGGTGGSSSAILSANTLRRATLAVIERGRRIAAQALEAAPADIEFSAGVYRIAGTDRSLGLFDVAALALTKELPAAVAGPLAETRDFADTIATFPHGAMAIEVEIDRETGQVGIARVTAAIDVGPRLDSSIVEGQIHGAIVQGIGQAVMEHCLYDRDTGQLLTGSLMDYAIPRADDLPMIAEAGVPASAAPGNAMGLRGVGEIGTNGAPAAVVNAVVDALHPLGVRHVDMPATAETIWRALGGGR